MTDNITIDINGITGGYITQDIHTTELRFLVQYGHKILQYRNRYMLNDKCLWTEWKDVPTIIDEDM